MVRGGPGSGKTILGLHFLTWAAARGEPCLFITFGESERELRAERRTARLQHRRDLVSGSQSRLLVLRPRPANTTFFRPPKWSGSPITRRIREEVAARKPARVFIDGLTQLRYLTANPFQFRKEALAFLRYLCEIGATVLFTSESNEAPDQDLQFIADAVIELEFCDTRRRS